MNIFRNFKLTTDDLIFAFVNSRIESLSFKSDYLKFGKQFIIIL